MSIVGLFKILLFEAIEAIYIYIASAPNAYAVHLGIQVTSVKQDIGSYILHVQPRAFVRCSSLNIRWPIWQHINTRAWSIALMATSQLLFIIFLIIAIKAFFSSIKIGERLSTPNRFYSAQSPILYLLALRR